VKIINKLCPVSGDVTMFETEQDARAYYELAIRYWISFMEIHRMIRAALFGPEGFDNKFDLMKELRQLGEEGEQDAELLANFDLPSEEVFQIWLRSRQSLQRLANFFPLRREKIEAAIAEQEEVMIAILEQHKGESK
jgi:uncharacterized protein (DUF433 family)